MKARTVIFPFDLFGNPGAGAGATALGSAGTLALSGAVGEGGAAGPAPGAEARSSRGGGTAGEAGRWRVGLPGDLGSSLTPRIH